MIEDWLAPEGRFEDVSIDGPRSQVAALKHHLISRAIAIGVTVLITVTLAFMSGVAVGLLLHP